MSEIPALPPGNGTDFPPLPDPTNFIRDPKVPTSAANSVTVSPGGGVFATITDALNSIHDASRGKQYLVSIGPGTYAEQVVCKEWVFLQGSGLGVTVIQPKVDPMNPVAVVAASNSALQNLSVWITAAADTPSLTAVLVQGCQGFSIENSEVLANDARHHVGHVYGLVIDYGTSSSGSIVYISYSVVTANGASGNGSPVGFLADRGAYVQFTSSKLVARGNTSTAFGGLVYSGCYAMLAYGVIEGDACALANMGPNSSVTAKGCVIVGPTFNVDIQ